MPKRIKLKELSAFRILVVVFLGFSIFIATGFMAYNNFSASSASAAYQTCVKYGASSTLKSFTFDVKGAAINIKVNSNGKGDFTIQTVTPNLRCSKVSGRISCALSNQPNKPIFSATYGNNIVKKCVNFVVR